MYFKPSYNLRLVLIHQSVFWNTEEEYPTGGTHLLRSEQPLIKEDTLKTINIYFLTWVIHSLMSLTSRTTLTIFLQKLRCIN